jgi:malate dehydrogenase (oxaloacetate-decarboxylating)(NADP+)
MIDVGTNNEELLNDALYLGYPKKRINGQAYYELLDEFVEAIQNKFPKALIQFEDFLTPKAYGLLKRYRNKVLCFNDDIQGTAAMSLAGIYSAIRITKTPFTKLKILFVGAGSAATGIADLTIISLVNKGLTKEEALQNIYFVDVKGLIVKERNDLMEHNLAYAKEMNCLPLLETIEEVKPHIIIGATGAQGTFNKEVIALMSSINEKPIVFALSNPTSKSECTAEEAYNWSNGKAIFASGSPFKAVSYKGKIFISGQGNNVYIFPGVGLGVLVSGAKFIPEEFFIVAAETLSQLVTQENLDAGSVYPDLNEIRTISVKIGVAVANKAYELNLTDKKRPKNIEKEVLNYCYNPMY